MNLMTATIPQLKAEIARLDHEWDRLDNYNRLVEREEVGKILEGIESVLAYRLEERELAAEKEVVREQLPLSKFSEQQILAALKDAKINPEIKINQAMIPQYEPTTH